ncbi:MAG: helicase-related protein [Pseudomonadota bacterium]
MSSHPKGRVTAVLGPTNTGKTHYAIERMLAHRTGVMGLPLRLLAREVYDRIVKIKGPNVVALVTGEERLVPERVQYWVCTVEAMPQGMGCDFLAVDEIQLCADPERGHIFTERLLHARGLHETLFLGAETMRGAIADLVPGAFFLKRERMSTLSYTGAKKASRMQPRSAIVGFSVDNVYAIAELLRRQKGGAAVVMGALSPRTRNAQVAMYQEGDVDFLVATDAIGMGLNLDINHVAFSATTKFDGRKMRPLMPNELAQIAGRAGRYTNDGTFGVTGEAGPLHEEVVAQIESNRFAPVRKLQWRNASLRFGSVDHLIRSLESHTDDPWLTRVRDADDILALKALSTEAEILARASDKQSVELLWDVCRVPDFRGISQTEHASLLGQIYKYLHQNGQVPDDWLARQVKFIDRTEGDIDALSKRLAYIRTWTYVAQRNGWLNDPEHWRGATRAVEDRLSDALHERLTQRFVDRRTSVLLRRLKQKEALVAEINQSGEIAVEGQFVGKIEGFRFSQDASASPDEAKTLRAAALKVLTPEFHLRADRLYNSPDTELDFTEQGGLMWGEHAVGKLVAGSDPLKPTVYPFVDDEAGPEVIAKVGRRLQHFVDRKIAILFDPMLQMQKDDTLTGLARGFAFRMIEGLGIIPRDEVAEDVKALDQETRGVLRKHGIRFGQFTIFMPLMLKPAPTRMRLVLWSLAKDLQEFPESPPPGLVTVPVMPDMPEGYFAMAGYRAAGERAIRIDMLERLADLLRTQNSRAGFEATPDMLSITGMTLAQFADLMQGLGYQAVEGTREKVKPVPDATSAAPAEKAAEAGAETGLEASKDASAEIPAESAAETTEPASAAASEPSQAEDKSAETSEGEAETANKDGVSEDAAEEPVLETFYTFTWGRRPQGRAGQRGRGDGEGHADNRGGKRQGKGGPKGKGKHGGQGQRKDGQKSKTYQARPKKAEKKIDPDNPFAAALMGLKRD